MMTEYCSSVLHPDNQARLAGDQFDLAIVDLMFNECGLALAHHLNIPSVGYWAFSFASGVQEFTPREALPSIVPAMMSYMGRNMTFLQRTWNMFAKLMSRSYMLYHTYIIGTDQAGPSHYNLILTQKLRSEVQVGDGCYQTVCWQSIFPPLRPPGSFSETSVG